MKLYIHQRSFSEELVIINPNDFPSIKIGDFLEIFHPDEKQSHLLAQVQTLSVELPQKGVISVEQGVASLFQLRAYQTVTVNRVPPDSQDVALDLVELVFKDQYISRSDMWRLKNSMIDTCLHIQQKVEQCGIRAQIQELWSRGGTVSCGVVNADTRFAFRSSTAMVYLFIQMSSEMWDFDTCGDLYMEKAVTGFLTELFTRWKEKNSNHEFSIILFSRTYFEADSVDDFPPEMRPRLHVHEDGRYYEDYYRVFARNERREDWMQILAPLKVTMQSYAKDIKDWQRRAGCLLKGQNSNSCQGNVLEAINLSLNVFDNHYMNRNFDRTGQLVVVVTPGAGVFEVDRALCKLTEQRMIDFGIGSDLVCLAEQPLHPVPLLKFLHALNKDVAYKDKYHIPHWLNYSFYLSPSQKRRYQSTQTNFISRLRLPDRTDEDAPTTQRPAPALPRIPGYARCHVDSTQSTISMDSDDLAISRLAPEEEEDEDEQFEMHDRKLFHRGRRRRSKVEAVNNPFSPDTLSVALTADRRRWTHAFPRGGSGEMVQPHHRQLVTTPSQESLHDHAQASQEDAMTLSSSSSSLGNRVLPLISDHSHPMWTRVDRRRRLGCVWGITGEQVWTPFLQSGMDWKSMTVTACFPTSTDFYPLRQSLENDYQEAPYTIDLEDERNLTYSALLQELISQRLIQDFQLVILTRKELAGFSQKSNMDQPLVCNPKKNVYVLSYGKTFHKLSLKPDRTGIEVVLYSYRQANYLPKLAYTYSLWPQNKQAYQLAHTRMYHKPVEHKWNYRDNYISLGGMALREGFELQECIKFWRSRFVLLPASTATLRQLAENGYQGNLDVFNVCGSSVKHQLSQGFLKFVEGLNRRRSRLSVTATSGGARSQRISQPDMPSTSPGIHRTSLSGTSTPTTFQSSSSTALTQSSVSSLLSGVAASRRESQQPLSPGDAGSTTPSAFSKDVELNLTSDLPTIVKAMQSPSCGVNFIGGDQRGLPSDSFSSAEAVSWIRRGFSDHPSHAEAMSLLQALLECKHIHAVFSPKAAKQFIYGYYLYCIPDSTPEPGRFQRRYSLGRPVFEVAPQQEWFEVACTVPQDKESETKKEAEVPGVCILPIYKSIVLEIWNRDVNQMEYCHASFHGNYQPDHAFDMELQWLTSTPGLLHDLLMNWFRRAQSAGFHLVPSPVDPFCFWEDISDPLCSPLFIPLALPDLDLPLDREQELLAQVQELILSRFGFLANHTSCVSPLLGQSSSDSPQAGIHVQYVHVTGTIFALPTPTQAESVSPRIEKLPCVCSTWKTQTDQDQKPGSWRSSSLLHTNQRFQRRRTPQEPGFLWITNTLLTKKWRSGACGDDAFRDALFVDFSRLCGNEDGRLEKLIASVMEG
ncbi:GATOR1 complex protein DEPDC5-like [Diadema setosum]|uniref:GATOR1 complex protein DEPDC5-like n=1 Tax=Diadema setosum TaxID=31175 RepID=UPI003B3A752F